jgi:hypothetical protein
MSTESDLSWPTAEAPPLLPARRRRWPLVILVVAFALVISAASYAWLNSGLFMQSTDRERTDVEAGSGDKAVLSELLAAQQKTTDDLAALDRAISDQQEQLKAMASRLETLSSKIDELKNATPQQPVTPDAPVISATPPAPVPPTAAAGATVSSAPRAVARPKKLPRSSNPVGPVSVGGAPLSAAPEAAARW